MLRPPKTINCQFLCSPLRMQSQSTHDMCGEVLGEVAGNMHMRLHQCGLSPLSKHLGTRNENANVYEQPNGACRASLMPTDQSESDSADSAGPSAPTKPLNASHMSNATIVGTWIPLPAPARNVQSENNPKSNGQRPPCIMTMASWSKRFGGILLTPRTPHAEMDNARKIARPNSTKRTIPINPKRKHVLSLGKKEGRA